MLGVLNKVFDLNKRELKRLEKIADKVEALESTMEALTDDELRGKTDEFRGRYAKGESIDSLLPEAFAVAREGSRRVLGMFLSVFKL